MVLRKVGRDAEECDVFLIPLGYVRGENFLRVTAVKRGALGGGAAELGQAVGSRGGVLRAYRLLEWTGDVEGVVDENDLFVRCGDELSLACLLEEDELLPDDGGVAGICGADGAQGRGARAACRGL